MTQALVNRSSETVGTRSAIKWSHVAVASALLLGTSLPALAGDMSGFIGGVVGGAIGQAMQQPYYQQPQYYQPPPQYYQQPQSSQPQQSQPSAEARRQYQANQAEAKRQKALQEKAKKEQDEARTQPTPAVGDGSGPVDVAMKRKNGNLWVPAQINKVVTIDFVIDSGASDITLPRDVYSTLIRSGTLTKANYIGTAQYGIADGSEVKGVKFKLASLQVGNQILTDVVASVMPSDSATPLLGLSFLSRFQSWAIDNNSGTLKLTPIPSDTPAGAPTQVAAATQQPLPDLTKVEPPAPQASAPAQLAAATAQPQSQSAAAATPAPQVQAATQGAAPETRVAAAAPAPRSGQVANSAFIAKETPAPAAASAATETKPETAAAIPAFPANTPYATARSSLLALGYGPAPLPDAGKCDSNTDSTCFPERAACAKAEGIQCDFLWRRGEQLIRVRTVAVPPTISSIECQVNCK